MFTFWGNDISVIIVISGKGHNAMVVLAVNSCYLVEIIKKNGFWIKQVKVNDFSFSPFQGPVHNVTFSPDGKYLASAGVDRMVLIWDLSNGELVAQLKGHTDTVYSLCYSREGSVLTSGECFVRSYITL